jgi:hypothetical protein
MKISDYIGGKDFLSSENSEDGLAKPNRRWIYE